MPGGAWGRGGEGQVKMMGFGGFFGIFEFYFIYILYSRFLLVIHFIHISVCVSIPISQFIPPPPPLSPLGVHTIVLYICVSISALQTGSKMMGLRKDSQETKQLHSGRYSRCLQTPRPAEVTGADPQHTGVVSSAPLPPRSQVNSS